VGAGLARPGLAAQGRLAAKPAPRLRVAVPWARRLRSLGLLGAFSLFMGLLVAAVLAGVIGLGAQALLHAVGNGP